MRRIFSVAAVALLALSTSASAQRRAPVSSSENPSPEIGIDAGLTFVTGTPSSTEISFPAQHIRLGLFISPVISIEPAVGLNRISSNGTSITSYTVGTGLLYHFSASRADNQFYVRPFVNLVGTSVSTNAPGGGTSSSDLEFGAGVGIKMPLRDRLASRFEANISHLNGVNAIGLLAGLSFYTH